MKRILGIDLGSSSIGWAIVDEYSEEITSNENILSTNQDKIVAIGSRVIPLSTEESTQFSKGQAISKNADRTAKRTQRKGYDRYQLRRYTLQNKLRNLGMYNGTTLHCSKLKLWELRSKSVSEQISLLELGRVLCHINQKRGYRTAKSDYGDKKLGAYVGKVISNHAQLHDLGMTVGQYLYSNLKNNIAFRCKDIVYPRNAYIEEFDAILSCQKRFYPNILTDETIDYIRNNIIFHQRPLKSCKHLVGKCELECHNVTIGSKIINCGPKVAPRSSPLSQVCKIWESINNIKVKNKTNDTLFISLEQKQAIFKYLNTNDKLNATTLKTLLGIKGKEWLFSKAVGAGIQGNTTYCAINQALGNYPKKEELLKFKITTTDGLVNTDTGELFKIIDKSFEQQPLYTLWHTLYSISNIEELQKVLKKNFGINDDEVINRLCQIDFVKSGYSNKSSRAMRKILPYLQDGEQYYDAKLAAGYNDITPTKAQNEARELVERLQPIQKGELRQPVVEKVLNQLVNLVNALMEEYGRFDEIRVELARELKQNQKEREFATKAISNNNKKNERAAGKIKELGFTPTRSRIQKYRLWDESKNTCVYCGETVNIAEFLLGFGVEVEHIIPRSVLFDDSFSNKVCACRECNKEKDNSTAYDYMKSKGDKAYNDYIERINQLAEAYNPKLDYDCGISKTKRDKLLMSASELPTDFIARQLKESQYIAKKAKDMLQSICHNVYSTSGSITDFIRHIWGWDEVLHSLNFQRYKNAGLTEMVERDVNGKKVKVERIKDWSKRMDNRHHAVDALTIACTKQGYIQRINNLNSLKQVSFISFKDTKQSEDTIQKLTRLERYIKMQPHFSIAEVEKAVSSIVVSFKSGKRSATIGKRYIHKNGKRICVQRDIIIPRGALSEESIYGRIPRKEEDETKQFYVIKYPLSAFVDGKSPKKPDIIIDKNIRERVIMRLEQYKGKLKEAFAEPLLDHQGCKICSVRCKTGLKTLEPLHYNEDGKAIAFAKPGNNHHVAIYEDKNGKWQENIVTLWHAVERKKYGIDVIIKNCEKARDRVPESIPKKFVDQLPKSTWQFKFSLQQNEMFILGMEEELYQDAMSHNNYALLSKYLYRVQKIAAGDYYFRHHLETTVDDNSSIAKDMGKMKRLSKKSLFENNPHKVHISITGKITEI